MPTFLEMLAKHNPPARNRRWLYIVHDQLSSEIGPLAEEAPSELGIILIESEWYWRRRPYHKQKLALVWANQRHFALEQAKRGVAVRYIQTRESHREALKKEAKTIAAAIRCMEPAEWSLRAELSPLIKSGTVEIIPHDGWLTTAEDFLAACGNEPPYRMDVFYRYIRRQTGILMDDHGKPVGGRYSMDGENRKPWNGKPSAPELPKFSTDPIKKEVGNLVEAEYSDHPGTLDIDNIPATLDDAEALWHWALKKCLENFGEFEDAMSTASTGLFHTRISSLMNLHRILPRRVVEDAMAAEIPFNSKEGFIRQVIGWREFVRHIHQQTDGFRKLPDGDLDVLASVGDAGYQTWSGKPWKSTASLSCLDDGAIPIHLGEGQSLPAAYWGKTSGMNCLDTVVESVWQEGWSHHITRLMVLGNIATLLDISSRELTDWFWVAYTDAWDWVVEPNVLGMATFSVGDLMTTKPYVAGSAYINKMSDYCADCQFSPNGNCPIKRLYWAFLARHEDSLKDNQRMFMVMNSLRKRSAKDREIDGEVFDKVSAVLARGERLRPEHLPAK